MGDYLSDLVDKQLMLEKEIKREVEQFKTAINSLASVFEKDTGVYLKGFVSELYFDSIEVEIDFEKTREMRKYKK